MIEIVKSTGEADPPKVPYSPSPLTRGAAGARTRAAVSSPDYVRIFAGPAQNSRTPGSLPAGDWRLHWEAPIESPAVAVLFSGDRVFAHRGGGWTLFDRQGKQIARGAAGNAAMLLDSSAGMFYSIGPGNMLRANGLNDGDLRFAVPLGYTEAYAWRLLYRSGKWLVAAATEQKMFAPQVHPPEQSLIQIVEVGSPLKLSPYKVLLSVDAQQDLIFKNPNLLPVAVGDLIWAVLPGLLVRTSPAHEVRGAWQDTFEPVCASADEAGWLHLVVDAGGKRELWIVTPEGSRNVRVELKPDHGSPIGPPAIGYDHRVFLWTSQLVAAFSPEGTHLWDSAIPGGIRGLTVAPDGNVLVAAGGRVYAVDPAGKSALLLEVTEALTTAPVLTAEGDLLAGTATKVICYRVK